MTGEIPTSVPGITFGSTMERLANMAHKFSIVRSFTTESARTIQSRSSAIATPAARTSAPYARVAGANNPRNGMPRNLSLFRVRWMTSPDRRSWIWAGLTAPVNWARHSRRSRRVAGQPQAGEEADDRSRPADDRRSLLASLDQWRRVVGESDIAESFDLFQSQAYQTLTGTVAEAFDISKRSN